MQIFYKSFANHALMHLRSQRGEGWARKIKLKPETK